ncbi:unnamed protein product, partial [Owenia fusiformis]
MESNDDDAGECCYSDDDGDEDATTRVGVVYSETGTVLELISEDPIEPTQHATMASQSRLPKLHELPDRTVSSPELTYGPSVIKSIPEEDTSTNNATAKHPDVAGTPVKEPVKPLGKITRHASFPLASQSSILEE